MSLCRAGKKPESSHYEWVSYSSRNDTLTPQDRRFAIKRQADFKAVSKLSNSNSVVNGKAFGNVAAKYVSGSRVRHANLT